MPTPRLPFPTTPSEYIQAPTGGWSPDVPTWELPTDAAPLIENFQIKPGKLRVRPAYVAPNPLQVNGLNAGYIPYNNGGGLYEIVTRRLFVSSSARVEPQNVHRVINSIGTTGLTGVVEDSFYLIGSSGAIKVVVGSGLATGSRQIDFGGKKYSLTYASPSFASIVYNDGIASWATAVIQDNGFLTAPTVITGSPVGGFDIYGWLSRVWIAGGNASGSFGSGITPSTTALFFSNPVQTLTAVTDWTDPVSGLYNKIEVDADHTNPIVALASVPAGLVILRQNSVFILRGTDPTSYVIRPVSKQAGCIDARSVVEMDSKVYFMSEQGAMVTDGTSVQNVSGALQDELYRQIATWNTAVQTSTGAYCTCCSLSDSKILVTFGHYSTGNSSVNYSIIGDFSAIFDPSTGVWTKVSTALNPTTGSALGPVVAGYGEVSTLGNTFELKVETNFVTSAVAASVTGPSSLHDVATYTGSTVYTPITATWTTKSPQAALGGRQKIQIKNTYLDYAVSTGAPAATVAYQLTDRLTGGTLTTNSITASTNASDPRQYLERDEFHEVSDLGITVTLAGTNTTGAASVPKAEVHGIGLVFSGAADMRPIV